MHPPPPPGPLAAPHPHAARRGRAAGLSLIELLVATAIVGILLVLAAPGLQQWITRQALTGTAALLETDLHLARTEALARQEPVRLSVQVGQTNCYVVHTGAVGDCRCRAGGGVTCSDAATALRWAEIDTQRGLALTATSRNVEFDPRFGTVTPTTTLRLVDGHGRAIHQIVNVMGRVRACSPGATVPGFASC